MIARQMRSYAWNDGKELHIGRDSLVMGVLNITDDSFSDGGKWNTLETAMKHAKDMVEDGAAIVDIGAESTRPGFTSLSAKDETDKLMKILPSILACSPVPVSVDSYHYETMDAALRAGAHIVNDIWGFQYDDGSMARVTAEYKVPAVLMHNQDGETYDEDILESMKKFFDRSIDIAVRAGVEQDKIILDPGIGFGKTAEQNMEVLTRLDELTREFPFPWLLGVSRKRFIGAILDLPAPERDEGTAAVNLWGIGKGCSIFRVHNVKISAREIKVWDALNHFNKEN